MMLRFAEKKLSVIIKSRCKNEDDMMQNIFKQKILKRKIIGSLFFGQPKELYHFETAIDGEDYYQRKNLKRKENYIKNDL